MNLVSAFRSIFSSILQLTEEKENEKEIAPKFKTYFDMSLSVASNDFALNEMSSELKKNGNIGAFSYSYFEFNFL